MENKVFNPNPKDLIDETYNGDKYRIIERKINPLVMPENIVKDIDALDAKHFYGEQWNEIIHSIK